MLGKKAAIDRSSYVGPRWRVCVGRVRVCNNIHLDRPLRAVSENPVDVENCPPGRQCVTESDQSLVLRDGGLMLSTRALRGVLPRSQATSTI
jgi:hypothetical protein